MTAKFLGRICAVGLAMAAASPAFALSEADWVKRIYADLLQRSPTSQELSAAVTNLDLRLQGNPDLVAARMPVALAVLRSDEWVDNLVGANFFKPGYAQLLLGNGLDFDSYAFYRCRFQRFQESDEEIISSIISSTGTTSCQTASGAPLIFLQPTFSDYVARANALNPGLANRAGVCGGEAAIQVVIDQIYQDLLGRHASVAELNLSGTDAEQVSGTLLAMGIGGSIGAPQEHEYLQRLVRSAFLRFYYRLPDERPNTAPDGQSELEYFVDLSRAATYRNEWFYALMVSLPEYDTAEPQPPPIIDAALVDVAPADITVSGPSLEIIGPPPPVLTAVVSPLFLNQVVTSSLSAAATLT